MNKSQECLEWDLWQIYVQIIQRMMRMKGVKADVWRLRAVQPPWQSASQHSAEKVKKAAQHQPYKAANYPHNKTVFQLLFSRP